MSNVKDRIRWFDEDMKTELSKIRLELARGNAMEVLKMAYEANIISPTKYHENLEKICDIYKYED